VGSTIPSTHFVRLPRGRACSVSRRAIRCSFRNLSRTTDDEPLPAISSGRNGLRAKAGASSADKRCKPRSVSRFRLGSRPCVRRRITASSVNCALAFSLARLGLVGCRSTPTLGEPRFIDPVGPHQLDARPEVIIGYSSGDGLEIEVDPNPDHRPPSWTLTVQRSRAARLTPNGRQFAPGWPRTCSDTVLSEEDSAAIVNGILALRDSGLEQRSCGDHVCLAVWVEDQSSTWHSAAKMPLEARNPIRPIYERLVSTVPKLAWRRCTLSARARR
jgi:hypothetical protein